MYMGPPLAVGRAARGPLTKKKAIVESELARGERGIKNIWALIIHIVWDGRRNALFLFVRMNCVCVCKMCASTTPISSEPQTNTCMCSAQNPRSSDFFLETLAV